MRRDNRRAELDRGRGHECVHGVSARKLGAREQSVRLEEFVDRLGLRDLTLVMQDWGGPIGLGLAGRRPELVRRIVVGNTWAWPTRTGTPRGLFSKIAGGPSGTTYW